jgi:hypothetical protein
MFCKKPKGKQMPLTDIDSDFKVNLLEKNEYNDIEIIFNCLGETLSTKDIKNVRELIEFYYPSVLTTKCHNPNHLSFEKEVENTPLAHLFEHILIQNIKEIQEEGKESVCCLPAVSARTKWNWNSDPRGVFHITISGCALESVLLELAINRSIAIYNSICSQKERQTASCRLSSSSAL